MKYKIGFVICGSVLFVLGVIVYSVSIVTSSVIPKWGENSLLAGVFLMCFSNVFDKNTLNRRIFIISMIVIIFILLITYLFVSMRLA